VDLFLFQPFFQAFHSGVAMRAERCLLGVLQGCLAWSLILQGTCGADPPGKEDSSKEVNKLNDVIEKSVNWYDVLPAEDSTTPLRPHPVIRWRNVVRGQEGEAMMVVWPHNGRPIAMASLYPWDG
jgi:hypothetical protein